MAGSGSTYALRCAKTDMLHGCWHGTKPLATMREPPCSNIDCVQHV